MIATSQGPGLMNQPETLLVELLAGWTWMQDNPEALKTHHGEFSPSTNHLLSSSLIQMDLNIRTFFMSLKL